MLKGSAAAAVWLALGRFAPAESRSANAFFKDWRKLAERLFDDKAMGEERYIRELNTLISQLPLDAVPPREKVVYDGEGLKTGPAWFEGRIFIVELTLQPHAVIQPHNHPSHNAVSLGIAGACRYEHYQIADEAPPSEPGTPPFMVRRTRSGVLLPGRLSELTRTRDNIHTFQAGKKGATLLDFTTTMDKPGTEFSALKIEARPRDAFGTLYEARWLGNPYR
jgi:hypothetical protein